MSRIRGKNSKIEWRVRRLAHSLGYRYRLHQGDLPGKPDLVFRPRRKAIFVHGCFWHGHDCGRYNLPKTRVDFWRDKIESNMARDRKTQKALRELGWNTLVIWECETRNLGQLAERITRFLDGRT